ncbi:MAG: DnaD domain protein [Lachnospiraceae bacterium]|nr:DnaD domain protein [Lachnospiraceae bacterium]
MNTLTLCGDYSSAFTFVQNEFIDYYMKDINESQIKIYLYLLRIMGSHGSVSVSSIADFFNDSERDVIRALKYLDKKNLIMLEYDNDKQPAGIRLLNAKEEQPVIADTKEALEEKTPRKKNYSGEELLGFQERSDISQLIYAAETYLNRTLSRNDLCLLLYMNEGLKFSPELIEYLIEYCVSNKKKSMRYMESVALSWAQKGITSAEEAKAATMNTALPGEVYRVFHAFGIKGRAPADPEVRRVEDWQNRFGFPAEILEEACARTIMHIHEPSFDYAEKILERWFQAGVKSMSDIAGLDEAHEQKKQGKRDRTASQKKAGSSIVRGTDYDALVRELMAKQ